MVLVLGTRTFHLATRTLVVATGPGHGADVVEVPAAAVGEAIQTSAGPVAATVTGGEEARLACRAGAAVIVDLAGLADETTVRAAAEGGAVIVGVFDEAVDAAAMIARARAAEVAGVPPACILLSPALPAQAGMLARTRRLASLGYPLVYSAGASSTPAAVATAVVGGCRIVRTADARTARRVGDALAAVLEARQ